MTEAKLQYLQPRLATMQDGWNEIPQTRSSTSTRAIRPCLSSHSRVLPGLQRDRNDDLFSQDKRAGTVPRKQAESQSVGPV